MLLALYPLARGYLSLTIFFLLSIDGFFVKGVSNNFLVRYYLYCWILLSGTCRYYLCTIDDNSHDKVGESMLLPGFVLWTGEVHVFFVISERCMLNTWFEVKPIFVQAINTP